MKKGKVFLTATCALALITGVFAFRTHNKFASANIFVYNSITGKYTQETPCYYPQETTTFCESIDNTGTYYALISGSYEALPTGTVLLYDPPTGE